MVQIIVDADNRVIQTIEPPNKDAEIVVNDFPIDGEQYEYVNGEIRRIEGI